MNPSFFVVYDNLLTMQRRSELYNFIVASKFRIGWKDTDAIEVAGHQYLHSPFSEDDMERFGLLKDLKGTQVDQHIAGLHYKFTMVNLSVPCDCHWVHVHPGQTIILYYANMHWEAHWGGETLFFDEAGKEVIYGLSYTPGRVIVFDGKQPHTIRPQSVNAPHYRFTVAVIYENEPPKQP